METTLHRQLKAIYADDVDDQEVVVDGYRIDAVRNGWLIEIQQASLSAFRDKIRHLLELGHKVHIVKPICARKYLVKRKHKDGPVIDQRYSPSRHTVHMLFLEMVHFTKVFPHPKLKLEILLTEQEEQRQPIKVRSRRKKPYKVLDRSLRGIQESLELRSVKDLIEMIPRDICSPFSTADLSESIGIDRWLAQKMAYCLRETGGIQIDGKSGNSLLYSLAVRRRRKRRKVA